ncbi:MAG: PAS domain S-box protein [Chloroflexota bacterium]
MTTEIAINQSPILISTAHNQQVIDALVNLSHPLIDIEDPQQLISEWHKTYAPLVILDDVALCAQIRQDISASILLITDNIDDALSAGADDCVPMHPDLLTIRVQALMKHQSSAHYDKLPAMVNVVDKDNRIVYVNDYWLTQFGYTSSDILGKPLTYIMSDISQHVSSDILESFRKTKQTHTVVFRYVMQSRQEFDVLADSMLLNDGQVLIVSRDISELQAAEDSLRQSHNELTSILRALPDIVLVVDHSGSVIHVVNQKVQNDYLDTQDIHGQNLAMLLPNKASQQVQSMIQDAIRDNTIQHIDIELADKAQTHYLQVTASPINSYEMMLIIRDVTEQRLIKKSLSESEKSYRRLFENATDAIFVVDIMTGNIIQASPQASVLLGYSQQELLTMTIDTIESDQIAIHDSSDFDIFNTDKLTVETMYQRRDGTTIDVEITSRVIIQNKKLVLISFVRDISERKRNLAEVERQRNIAQALLNTASILNETDELEVVLDTILSDINRVMPCDSANVMLIDNEYAKVMCHSGYIEQGFKSEDISNVVIPLSEASNLNWIVANKMPLRLDDIQNSPQFKWLDETTSEYVQSLLTAPIIRDGEVIGFISLDSKTTNTFSQEHEPHLMAFANQVAIAMQKASMMQSLQAYTNQLEERVNERTQELTTANEHLKQTQTQLKNLNEELELRVAVRTLELSQANTELIKQIEEKEKAEGAERTQRLIAEALRDGIAQLATLHDRDTIFDRMLTLMGTIIPHDASSILLLYDDIVEVVHSHGYDGKNLSLRISLKDLRNLEAAKNEKRPKIISDVSQYADWTPLSYGEWIQSVMTIPIIIDDEVIGFVTLDSQHPHHFTEQQADWLLSFGEQVGLAIRNARYTTDLEAIVRERTERIEFEQAQLRAILDGVTDGIVYTDLDGQPQYINSAMTEITGFSETDWLNSSAQKHLNSLNDTDTKAHWQRIIRWLESNNVWTNEYKLLRKDNSVLNASVSRTLVRDQFGYGVGIVTVVRDISAEKQLAEQKARFITKAAHELRTPITNLKTRMFLVKRQPDKIDEHLAVASSVITLMQNLVEHMFDVSRFERGILELAYETFELGELLSDVIQYQMPQAERLGIALKLEIPEHPIIVAADPYRLTQVVTNLIGNALKYAKSESDIILKLDADDQSTTIAVIDFGKGIEPEHLAKLFQPFYQVSENSRGVGLGLTIVQEIVHAHQGTIHVESQLGEGTTFYVRLPLKSDIQE